MRDFTTMIFETQLILIGQIRDVFSTNTAYIEKYYLQCIICTYSDRDVPASSRGRFAGDSLLNSKTFFRPRRLLSLNYSVYYFYCHH